MIQCPACNTTIDDSRIVGNTAICQCSWTGCIGKPSKDPENSIIIKISIFAILLGGMMWHSMKWNEFSISVLPLQYKNLTGKSTHLDHLKMFNICTARKLSQCQINQLDLILKNRKLDLTTLVNASQFYLDQKLNTKARKTLKRYIKQKGKNVDLIFAYGELCEQAGHSKTARRMYIYANKLSPKRMHPKSARNYVRLLIHEGKYKKALMAIKHYRKTSRQASYFMSKELKKILKKLTVAKI